MDKMNLLERVALNEVAPDDIELKPEDKAFNATKKYGTKAADTILSVMAGDLASKLGKKIGSKIINKSLGEYAKDTTKNINEVQKLSDFGRTSYNKALIDEGKKMMAENPGAYDFIVDDMMKPFRQYLPEDKIPIESAYKMVGKLNQHKIPSMPESYDSVARETKRLLGDSVSKGAAKVGENAGKIGGAMGVLSLVLSPISTLSDKHNQKIARDTKKKVLWKLYAFPGEHFDLEMAGKIRKMSDEEVDSLISQNIDAIKELYSE